MTGGLAAAQIQERYESKDQMEESWAFNTMFLFHTYFYILVKLGRKDTLTKPLLILSFCLLCLLIEINEQQSPMALLRHEYK